MVGFPELSGTESFKPKRKLVEDWMESYFSIEEEGDGPIRKRFDRLDKFTQTRLDQTQYKDIIGGEITETMPAELEKEIMADDEGAASQVDDEVDIGEAKYHAEVFTDSAGVSDFISDHVDYARLPEGEMDTTVLLDGIGDFAGKMAYPLDDGRFYVAWNNLDVDGVSPSTDLIYQLAVVPTSRENEINFYESEGYKGHPGLDPSVKVTEPTEEPVEGPKEEPTGEDAFDKYKAKQGEKIPGTVNMRIRQPDGTTEIQAVESPDVRVDLERVQDEFDKYSKLSLCLE
jgi:hypothetical protein